MENGGGMAEYIYLYIDLYATIYPVFLDLFEVCSCPILALVIGTFERKFQ